MSSTRHVDSTSPERTRRALAYGHRKDGETTIHTVCAECGTVIVEGPKVDGMSSHGLCPRHYRMQMASIAVRAATKYGTAIRNHDRQSDEVVRAHNRMVAAIYDIVDAPSEALEDE